MFRDFIGPTKYRAYLNYWYGVIVEEALQLAVEEEVRKRYRARGYPDSEDFDEEKRVRFRALRPGVPRPKETKMAKKSQIHRDLKRIKLIKKYAAKRAELRAKLNDANASIEDKLAVQEEFAKLPRNSCPTRLNRRCEVSGRSKGYYRKFGISRIALRELALRGQLPGMRKSSW